MHLFSWPATKAYFKIFKNLHYIVGVISYLFFLHTPQFQRKRKKRIQRKNQKSVLNCLEKKTRTGKVTDALLRNHTPKRQNQKELPLPTQNSKKATHHFTLHT